MKNIFLAIIVFLLSFQGVRAQERNHLQEQVLNTYQSDLVRIEGVLARAKYYEKIIFEAAQKFGYDPEVAIGVACHESSLIPWITSLVGAYGLFQIYDIPPEAEAAAERALGHHPDRRIIEDNIYLGLATLVYYRKIMGGDLALGLWAYNMGDEDLKQIISNHPSKKYFEIRDHLGDGCQSFPEKVLAFALGYRALHKLGYLPFSRNDNDKFETIFSLGIPGLSPSEIGVVKEKVYLPMPQKPIYRSQEITEAGELAEASEMPELAEASEMPELSD
jgi:hypothetical protein